MARKAKSTILTKTCTKTGRTFRGTFEELRESFYRDSSQRDGLSPWSKDAERAYNRAYREGLKGANVERKSDIPTKDTKARNAFENAMRPERVTRGRKSKVVRKIDNTRTRKAKATTAARKRARRAKANA